MKPIPLRTLPLFFLLMVGGAVGIPLVAQQGTPSLSLTGTRHSMQWDLSVVLRLGTLSVISGDSETDRVFPDSSRTAIRLKEEGGHPYKGICLYSEPFLLSSSLHSLRIPLEYHITVSSLKKGGNNGSATLFADIIDEKEESLLARFLGHGIEGEIAEGVDSVYSREFVIATDGGEEMWNIEGDIVSLAGLLGRKVRIRLMVITDPVMPASGVRLETSVVGKSIQFLN